MRRLEVGGRVAEETSARFPMRIARQLTDLAVIFDDDVDGVIWERRTPPTITSGLSSAPVRACKDGRYVFPLDRVRHGVRDHFEMWGWPAGRAADWLADDVDALALHFARILSVPSVQLRIELVYDDACRKFHRDVVKTRLICTYCGPGTEYQIMGDDDDPRHVRGAPTGCPILLKGKLWPQPPGETLVHRSPSIEGTGAWRLVVVLDDPSFGVF